jgi:hypothetical protein
MASAMSLDVYVTATIASPSVSAPAVRLAIAEPLSAASSEAGHAVERLRTTAAVPRRCSAVTSPIASAFFSAQQDGAFGNAGGGGDVKGRERAGAVLVHFVANDL